VSFGVGASVGTIVGSYVGSAVGAVVGAGVSTHMKPLGCSVLGAADDGSTADG
jgi:hypothetical protein